MFMFIVFDLNVSMIKSCCCFFDKQGPLNAYIATLLGVGIKIVGEVSWFLWTPNESNLSISKEGLVEI